ncbi:hypothetical protein JTE90_014470 [Oedothorax gibbosus]|uniref:Uncharacterized protein n=1 Tax=Oedothorax gibbosus TaxID=931172 RepID=A0AAV6VLF3_9ARAC|nr:hypothetical protein JTE90_014470 [Oedothorax gibbosus]
MDKNKQKQQITHGQEPAATTINSNQAAATRTLRKSTHNNRRRIRPKEMRPEERKQRDLPGKQNTSSLVRGQRSLCGGDHT